MALKVLRSSTANKRPLASALADGQLAANTEAASPGLFFKNASGSLVKVGPVHVGATAPNASPASGGETGNTLGEQWLDTSGTNPVLKIWDGSSWASEIGEFVSANGDTMTGALVMDNQQQIRFRETTANGTNYIAIQAPASVASDKTLTLPDVTGTLVSTGDTGTVTSTMIANGTIVDADVNASAAIAGTKISPDFGAQNVTTTGTSTAASFIPSSSTVPTNGVYLPAANSVALATNGAQRLLIDSAGQIEAAGLGSAAAPAWSFVDDPNTGIYSPGADQLAISTAGTERARIDSSGRLLVGTSNARSNFFNSTNTSRFQIEGAGVSDPVVSIVSSSSSGSVAATLILGKQNSGAVGGNTVVASGDFIGGINFQGNDGTEFVEAASIYALVDGTPGTNDMPGRLVFSTTADGASTPTERMRISSDGSTNHYTDHTNVHIARSGNAAGTTDSIYVGVRSATNTINGTVVYRVYTNGTYATISDANQKKNVQTTRDGYLDDLNKLRVVKYNWNEQEDTDPKELGLIAQEVEQVFPGLVTQIADDTEEQQYKGIKTSVLPFMLLKALQEASAKIEVLEAEVAALKAQ